MNKSERDFQELVLAFHAGQGRHDLPWRQTTDPYHILVSELMLQQTQVERVVPKYEAFIARWPTVHELARAELGQVLKEWQGLGYNRRAKYLHECAIAVVERCAGRFPRTETELRELPGIGPYTAGAVLAFAYDQPVVVIDTNVRRVYLHHFFPSGANVPDSELEPFIHRTLLRDRPRVWYSALMDYGTKLKKTVVNPNQRSKHYTKQSKFEGSDRQIRGAILKVLMDAPMTVPRIKRALYEYDPERVETQLSALEREGMVGKSERRYRLG